MTKEERIKLYAALAAPFPEEAVERTSGAATGRGYDTTGIKYQYLADRLNEVLGVGGFRTERTITIKGTTTAKGRPAFEAIAEVRVELGEWQDGEFVVFAEAWGDGGHTAMSEADARKGSFTNAFKKAVAFMGPGRAAYRGTIDDDHVPEDDLVSPPPSPGPVAVPPARPARVPEVTPVAPSSPAPTVPADSVRNRLSSKQYAALRSLARTTGYDERGFKEHVRMRFGVEPAYLSKGQASILIGELLAATNGHGAREAG
jgi:hypothetical protein